MSRPRMNICRLTGVGTSHRSGSEYTNPLPSYFNWIVHNRYSAHSRVRDTPQLSLHLGRVKSFRRVLSWTPGNPCSSWFRYRDRIYACVKVIASTQIHGSTTILRRLMMPTARDVTIRFNQPGELSLTSGDENNSDCDLLPSLTLA